MKLFLFLLFFSIALYSMEPRRVRTIPSLQELTLKAIEEKLLSSKQLSLLLENKQTIPPASYLILKQNLYEKNRWFSLLRGCYLQKQITCINNLYDIKTVLNWHVYNGQEMLHLYKSDQKEMLYDVGLKTQTSYNGVVSTAINRYEFADFIITAVDQKKKRVIFSATDHDLFDILNISKMYYYLNVVHNDRRYFCTASSKISALQWHPRYKYVVAVALDHIICAWNYQTSQQHMFYRDENSVIYTSVCWNSDGTELFAGCKDGTICSWNMQKDLQKIYQLYRPIISLAHHSQKNLLAAVVDTGVTIFENGKKVVQNMHLDSDSIEKVHWHPLEKKLALVSQKGKVYLSDLTGLDTFDSYFEDMPVAQILLLHALSAKVTISPDIQEKIIASFTQPLQTAVRTIMQENFSYYRALLNWWRKKIN